jgi:GalNAc-alpha-(1->4)-GalNAc-alpha-(1->3)-diNAcBac-PP-undecaprenol alpha-1,4-N-acetyl-D-galactosaminyltransferase
MKVIFLAGSLNQGGAEFQLLSLAKLFKDKGHEVEVFALTDYDFYVPFVQSHSIQYTCLKNDQAKIKRIFLTAKKIRSSKPDLIISYLKVVSQVAIVAKMMSMTKAKLIVGERTSLIKPWHDRYYFNLLLLADQITVNSVSKLNNIKKRFPLLRNRLNFMPNIIEIQDFKPDLTASKETNSFKIIYVGRISPEKNILTLVQSIIKLLEKGKKLTLELYGDNKSKLYYEKVKKKIDASSFSESIKLLGPVSNIKAAYKNADLLCLISSYEGFSNVIAEALACGIPIITSDIEENRFLVEEEVNGFLVNPDDSENVADGINKFLSLSLEQRQQIKENNRKKAELLFDKEAIYNNFIKIIEK